VVKGILNLINKESGSLHQAAYFLGLFAFLSQILGLVRDKFLAHNFGAGLELDLYYAAFRVPDFLFVSIASLVSVSVLIPVLVRYHDNKEECRKFINNVFSFFFLAIIIACTAVFLFAPIILRLLFPGFSSDNYSELVLLTRILLLSPIFPRFEFDVVFSSLPLQFCEEIALVSSMDSNTWDERMLLLDRTETETSLERQQESHLESMHDGLRSAQSRRKVHQLL